MELLKNISSWFENHYSTTVLLTLFAIVFGFFWAFNFSSFPIAGPEIMKSSGNTTILDTRFFYSSTEAYSALTKFIPNGLEAYLNFILFDFIFIATYSLAFAFLLTITISSICGRKSYWLIFNILPLAIGFLDFVENVCIIFMLKSYPVELPNIETISGYATLGKWILTIATMSLLAYGGILLFLRSLGYLQCTAKTA